MPPVSQSYRDARRRQIVDAARSCFARTGFHGTSMQDVFAESGLSAGAVYGYFSGKDDLVAAVIDEVMTEVGDALDALTDTKTPPPLHKVLAVVVRMLDRPPHGELARLATQVWAEAGRNPELHRRLSGNYLRMQGRCATLVQRYQHNGILDPDLNAQDLAQVLTALGPAFLSQRALLDTVTAETFTRGLAELLTSKPSRQSSTEDIEPG